MDTVPSYTVIRTVEILDDQGEWITVMDTKFNMEFTVHRSELLMQRIQPQSPEQFDSGKRSRSLEFYGPSSPSIEEIPEEQGESEMLPTPPMSPVPSPVVNNDALRFGEPITVRIRLRVPGQDTTAAGFTYKSFAIDKVLFIKSPNNMIPKRQMTDVVLKVMNALNFKTTIQSIEAAMLDKTFLQMYKREEFELHESKGVPVFDEKDFSSEEQRKDVQYARKFKGYLQEKRPVPLVTYRAKESASFIDASNVLHILDFNLWQTGPWVEKTLFPTGTRLELDNLVEIHRYGTGKVPNLVLMQTFQATDNFRITFLVKKGSKGPKQLVGIIIYNNNTLVGTRYVCSNCNERIMKDPKAFAHCKDTVYCGLKCAKQHWDAQQDDQSV